MRLPLAVLLGLLIGLPSSACTLMRAAQTSPDVRAPVRHVLPNGVRVLVQEYRSSEVVAVQLWVRAGGRDEAASELGLAHDLEHMLLAFYRRHYVPESFTLVVVGPVSPAETLRAAERTFGRLPRSGFQRLPSSVPTGLTPKKLEVQRPGALAYLGVGWLGPKLNHADTPAVDLLVSILGQSRSSRLPQSLRERLALVNSVSSDYAALEAGGIVTVTAQLEPANP